MKMKWPIFFVVLLIVMYSVLNQDASKEGGYQTGPEARAWLESNNNPHALASNRFESTEIAIDFVNLLYESGAQQVNICEKCIMDEPQRIHDEGGPYADGLIVTLSDEKALREKIIGICSRESVKAGFGTIEPKHIKDNKILLWWD